MNLSGMLAGDLLWQQETGEVYVYLGKGANGNHVLLRASARAPFLKVSPRLDHVPGVVVATADNCEDIR